MRPSRVTAPVWPLVRALPSPLPRKNLDHAIRAGYANRLAVGRDQDARSRRRRSRRSSTGKFDGTSQTREVVGPARGDLIALRAERDREHLPLVALLAAVGADFLAGGEVEELDVRSKLAVAMSVPSGLMATASTVSV